MRRARAGFTALELIIVLSVMFLLVSLGMAGIVPALRRSRIEQSANAVIDLCTDAIVWSRAQEDREATELYGVCFDGTGDPHVVKVVHGDPAVPANLAVLKEHRLNRNVLLYWGPDELQTTKFCWFLPTAGFPMDPATRLPQAFGTGDVTADPIPADVLSARSLDNRYRLGIGIYSVGIVHAETF